MKERVSSEKLQTPPELQVIVVKMILCPIRMSASSRDSSKHMDLPLSPRSLQQVSPTSPLPSGIGVVDMAAPSELVVAAVSTARVCLVAVVTTTLAALPSIYGLGSWSLVGGCSVVTASVGVGIGAGVVVVVASGHVGKRWGLFWSV
jgi:hypothetical protein